MLKDANWCVYFSSQHIVTLREETKARSIFLPSPLQSNTLIKYLFSGQNVPRRHIKMNTSGDPENHSLEILKGLDLSNSTSQEDGFNCDHFMRSYSTFSTDWIQGIIYFFYSAIFVVALTGNGLVCYVVLSSPRMKTVTNFFIMNLALGDILMTLFCVPPSFISILILQYWPFGPELCPTVNYLQVCLIILT